MCAVYASRPATSTTFANPAVHWSGTLLAILTLALSYLLRWSAKRMDLFLLLLWLIFTGLEVIAFLLLAMLSFHADRALLDFNLRQEWNDGLDVDTKVNEYHQQFDQLRQVCNYHLNIIGGGAAGMTIILVSRHARHDDIEQAHDRTCDVELTRLCCSVSLLWCS
jgi:hypothetical protein